ncbi:MAG: MFS transporter [Candidatus Thorarchaeota archaeon]
MKNWLRKAFNTEELPTKTQSLATKYFILFSTQIAQVQIASTFLVLFLLEMVSFEELGLLLAIQFILTALLDYPTGALADAIGHRVVLTLAYCTYAIGILFLLTAGSFIGFVPWVILNAIGISQESGALQSWFDNNYRAAIGTFDPDRKIYGVILGKIRIIWRIISIIMIVIGGVIAGLYSRRFLFAIQLFLVLVALALILLLMTNEVGMEVPRRTLKAYRDHLTGGLQFVMSSKGTIAFFFGSALFSGTASIWANLIQFPFYKSYSGTDEATGVLRATLFATSILGLVVITHLTKKVERPHKGLFLGYLLQGPIFFCLLLSFYETIPPPNKFVLLSFLALILLYQFASFSMPIVGILQSRFLLELVPNEYRNAVYSFTPSLVWLFSIPLIILGGMAISNHGFSAGIMAVIVFTAIGSTAVGLGLYWLSKPQIPEIPSLEDLGTAQKEVQVPTTG